MIPDKLFVYGTLLEGLGHPMAKKLQEESYFLGLGFFWGWLYDLGEYPAAVFGKKGDAKVKGEIYRLQRPEKTLRWLDAYEGIGEGELEPCEYERKVVNVFLEKEGEWMESWVYLYALAYDQLFSIPGGDYYSYIRL